MKTGYVLILLAGGVLVAALLLRGVSSVDPALPVVGETAVGSAAGGREAAEPSDEMHDEESRAGAADDCAERFFAVTRPTPEEVLEELSAAASFLAASGDAELKIASALLHRWDAPERAVATLESLDGFASDDAFVVWALLGVCDQRPVAGCGIGPFRSANANLHRNNGAFWLAYAIMAIEAGDDDAAIDALRHASTAAEFDTRYAEQLQLIDRGLAAATDWPQGRRVAAAFAFVSVVPYDLSLLTRRCRASHDGVWPELCEQVGAHMAAAAPDTLTRLIGMDLEKIVAEGRGDAQAIQAIEERKQQLRRTNASLELAGEFYNLLVNDEVRLQMYLADLDTYGEAEANHRLFAEAERLRRDPGYDQCNFRGNPYTAFDTP